MKRLVEFPLEEGGSIFVEVESTSVDQLIPASLPGDVAAKVALTLESALDKVQPAAKAIISKLRGLVDPPDEVSVEFGIKMSASAGAVLASADAEANFKVNLTWRRLVDQTSHSGSPHNG
jgi:hypothetical protein